VTGATQVGLAALVVLATGGAATAQDVAPPPADARAIVGAPRGRPLAGAELEAVAHDVAAVLRCPVCQGLSVADSPTDLARNMKQQVRELLAQGYEREQVLTYFESSYGEFVRLQPPLRGVNWLVWVAPVLGLLAGGFIIARSLRHAPPSTAPTSAAVPADDDALAPYVLRVREMAYGWPGGRPPQPPGEGKA
jgi:cytochrome c-type biogenesis protein CcmH